MQLDAGDIAITVLTVDEIMSGWCALIRRAKDAARLALACRHLAEAVPALASFRILAFNESAIARFEELKRQKTGVRAMDLRIAAVALEHGAVIATRNVADFPRVPGLVVEDWSAALG